MPEFLKNQESKEQKEEQKIEQDLSPEKGLSLGTVVVGHIKRIRDDKKKLKKEVDNGKEEFLRLGHKAAAVVLEKESKGILNEAEMAGQTYIDSLRKDIPDLDDRINSYKKSSGATDS